MKILSLRAQLQQTPDSEPGTVSVRILPFNTEVDYEGELISFAEGSVRAPDSVPVNMEHEWKDARSLVGKSTDISADGEAMFATLKISDTTLGRDVLELMKDGVLTDVSAGIRVDGEFASGPVTGELDHIALTAKGAFGNAEAPSKVLAAFTDTTGDRRSTQVEPVTEVEAPESPQGMAELTVEVAELRKVMAELSVPGAVVEPERQAFTDLKDFVITLSNAQRGDAAAAAKMAEFALASDTTTTAAGLVPDKQAQEIISVIAESRPYVETLPKDDIGSEGMTINYPTVTQKPDVEAQAAENTEVGTQAFTVGDTPFDIVTYAGANLASRQIVERSNPSYVEAFFAEMAGVYGQRTEAAAIAAGVAGAGNTAILADLGADAALTWAAFSLASSTIAGAVRKPATDVVLATDRWAQLLGLTDLDGRPLVIFGENGPSNAQGQAGLGTMSGQYGGLMVHHAPDAVTGTCLTYSRSRFQAFAEQSPVQLRAEVVSTLSWELGVYGLAVADMVKYGDGGYTLTLA